MGEWAAGGNANVSVLIGGRGRVAKNPCFCLVWSETINPRTRSRRLPSDLPLYSSGSPALRMPSMSRSQYHTARIGMLIDEPSLHPVQCRHRREGAGNGKVALKPFTGLRFLTR